jgi:hypothetical protein
MNLAPAEAPEDTNAIEIHNAALIDRASARERRIVISYARQADCRHCVTKIPPALSPGVWHGPRAVRT